MRSLALMAMLLLVACESEAVERPPPDDVTTEALALAREEGFDPRWAELYPVSALPPRLAALNVYGLNLAVPLLFAAALSIVALRHRLTQRAAARSGRLARERGVIEPGPTLLHGRVELEGGAGSVIELAITQVGVEVRGKKKVVRTRWTEVERQLNVRPFMLVLASGQRVRVEPDQGVRLVDDLDAGVRTSADTRVRTGRLEHGEAVYVSGVLERGVDPRAGYRGESDVLILRPPKRHRMLLSTRPLEHEARRRGRQSLRGASLTVLATVATLAALHWPFLALAHGHRLTTGVVLDKTIEHDDETRRLVTVEVADDGYVFREVLEERDYERIERGARVPLVQSTEWTEYAQLGQAPAEPLQLLLMTLAWLIALAVGFEYIRRRSIPWYEQARVEQTVAGPRPPFEPREEDE